MLLVLRELRLRTLQQAWRRRRRQVWAAHRLHGISREAAHECGGENAPEDTPGTARHQGGAPCLAEVAEVSEEGRCWPG